MPSLKLSNLFRRDVAPTLRERAANLRAQISTHVAEPNPPGDGMATVAPEHNEPATETDAELLRLGRLFEVASAREKAANEACNAAQREAERHMPERPASLVYRASDNDLNVHQNWMMAEALEGREVHSRDVERLRRIMPMMHEILRPIREGERAHRDHPGRRFDIVPHPEAQARAEEIVTAWDAWWAERTAVHGRYVTGAMDDAANEAGDVAASLAYRIAELQAHTAAGFRVKLRALAHYNRTALLSEIPEEADPDQVLSHSLWRDALGDVAVPAPATALPQAPLDPDRAWAIEQAAAVDLSGLTVGQLNVLYARFDAAAGGWSDASCVPWANEADGQQFRVLNAGGRIVDREDQRAAEIRSRIAAEIRTKAPADRFDVGWRLEVLIRHELLCEGSLEHAPELRAEMAEAWGG